MLSSAKSPATSIAPPVALDSDGWPLTPDAHKTASSKALTADEDALICSPPPVSKAVWHGGVPVKEPAKAEKKADIKAKKEVIKAKTKESKPSDKEEHP